MDVRALTGVQVGRIFGVSGPAVTKWAKKGCPRNEDLTYDLAAVGRWIRGGSLDIHRVPQNVAIGVLATTRPTVGAWEKKGCPRNADGSYDLAAVVQWRMRELTADVRRAREEANRGRQRRELAQAERAEIELAEMKGELLPRNAVVAGWIARCQVLKSMLLGMVRKLPQYGLDKGQAAAIDADVHTMLERLAGGQVALQLTPEQAAVIVPEDGK